MKLSKRTRDTIAGYLFITPNILGFLIFMAYPVVFSLIISFTDWDMLSDFSEMNFIGIVNYIDLFQDKWFWDSLFNNFYFAIFIPLQMLLALICAVILRDVRIPGVSFLKTMIFIPFVTSIVAISLIWFQMMHPSEGIINNFLRSFGISTPPLWFGSTLWVKPAIVSMLVWQKLGYNIILYLAGLNGIPESLYEASEIDGATGIKKFIHITLPMISPVSFFILILSLIETFKMWSNIQILTNGGPGSASTVIGYYIYNNAFVHGKMGYASSISWILMIIILAFTLIQWKGQKKWVNY